MAMHKGIKYIYLMAVLLTVSCTRENLDDCFSGVRLRFSFTLHEQPQRGNLFGENIAHIRAYVFNENGVLAQIVSGQGSPLTNDYVMPLSLDPGRYSILAWGSDNENFQNTHNILHAENLSVVPPQFKELKVGVSRMEDLRVMLDCVEAPEYAEGFKPCQENFDDLYFGAAGTRSSDGKSQYTIIPIEVKENETVERTVELIRNTNIVRVTIEGMEHLTGGLPIPNPTDVIDTWMSGANARYGYSNEFCPQASSVRYLPQYSLPSAATLQADIKTERLVWGLDNGNQLRLNVKIKNGKTLYDGSLLDLLRQAKDVQGVQIYKNQEDLDRIYIHPIRFVIEQGEDITDLYVRIFVHNWQVVILTPGQV